MVVTVDNGLTWGKTDFNRPQFNNSACPFKKLVFSGKELGVVQLYDKHPPTLRENKRNYLT